MDFEVKVDTRDVEAMLGGLAHRANAVMARAANRASARGRTVLKREANARYLVKHGDVGRTLKVTNAHSNKPFAVITSKDYHMGLEKFKLSPFRAVQSKGKNSKKRSPDMYRAAVKRGGALKGLGKKPFVATLQNGHIGIFRRTGRPSPKRKNAESIEGLYGPAVPQMLKNKEVMKKVEAETGKVLQERLIHEVDAVVKKYAD